MHRPPATIVAFDGLVVDTRAARALAIAESLEAEGFTTESQATLVARIHALLVGRSLDETVDAIIDAIATKSVDVSHDVSHDKSHDTSHHLSHDASLAATHRDLVMLRARRAYGAIIMRGLPLCDGAAAWLTLRAASHGRVILRADSTRTDVERMLEFSGLTDLVSAIRCSDDPPRSVQPASVIRSWRAIADRLQAQRLEIQRCEAFELDERTAAVARGYVGSVHTVDRL